MACAVEHELVARRVWCSRLDAAGVRGGEIDAGASFFDTQPAQHHDEVSAVCYLCRIALTQVRYTTELPMLGRGAVVRKTARNDEKAVEFDHDHVAARFGPVMVTNMLPSIMGGDLDEAEAALHRFIDLSAPSDNFGSRSVPPESGPPRPG